MADQPRKSLLYNLGAFFGNVARTVKADAPAQGGAQRRVVRQDVEEEVRETPQGKVTLRRTTIEEIEVHNPPSPGGAGPTGSPPA